MNPQTLQTQTSPLDKEKGRTPLDFQGWPSGPSGTLPIEEQESFSWYQILFDSEIQNLKNQISTLTNQIAVHSQIIQQNRKIIPMQNLRSTKLHLKSPLYVALEYEDGVFVIFSDDLNLYGYGDIELNAIRDFCKEVEYLYFDLKQSKKKLGKIMKENWEFLKNIIKEL